jgi:type II secretory pathway pseudopilin PulG
MTTLSFSRTRGITLIEALIALAVIALGLLALAKFFGDLTQSTGTSKARTEAIQIATSAIEELRSFALGTNQCAQVAGRAADLEFDDTAPLRGTNAWFEREIAVDSDGTLFAVTASVNWENPRGGIESVRIDSEITCVEPLLSADVSDGGLGSSSPLTPSPKGDAEHAAPGESYDLTDPEIISDLRPNTFSDGRQSGLQDGTSLLELGAGVALLDAAGNALLRRAQGSEFSTISGRVYIKDNDANPQHVRLMISAAGVCMLALNEAADDILVGTVATQDRYRYVSYQCYVGKGWYGNISVYLTSGFSQNDEVCTGDPSVSPDLQISTSRHPQLSIRRAYRGFVEKVGDTTPPLYLSAGISEGAVYPSEETPNFHDFLIARITGNARDSDCTTQLNLQQDSIPPVNVIAREFYGNSGKAVCLGPECPNSWPTAQTPGEQIVLSGVVRRGEGVTQSIEGIVTQTTDEACTSTLVDEVMEYTCTVSFTDNAWFGSVLPDPLTLPSGFVLNPSSHDFADGTSTSVGGLDFTLVESTAITTLEVSGTMSRNATNMEPNNISIDTGSCPDNLKFTGSSLTSSFRCITGEFLGERDFPMTVTFRTGGQRVAGKICSVERRAGASMDPALITGPGEFTLRRVNGDSLELDIEVVRALDLCP